MGIQNFGQQLLVFDYKAAATAKGFNGLNYQILTPGIYTGCQIDRVSDTSVQIEPGKVLITDSTNKTATIIETTLNQTITCSTVNNYIVFRFVWNDTPVNWMDMLAVPFASILPTDIIVGKCVYGGSTLTSIDYSGRTYGNVATENIVYDYVTNSININPGTNFWYVGNDGYIIKYVETQIKQLNVATLAAGKYYLFYNGSTFSTGAITGYTVSYNATKNGWYASSGEKILLKLYSDGTNITKAVDYKKDLTAIMQLSQVTINANTTTLPSSIAGTLLQIGNADAVITNFTLDSFATNNSIIFRRANTTNLAKSALLTDNLIGSVEAHGYGTSTYSAAARAYEGFYAAENWSNSAHGTYISWYTTAKTTTTTSEKMRLDDVGNLGILTSPNIYQEASTNRNLTISGSTGANSFGVLELITQQTDAAGNIVGCIQWTDKNSTNADKRVVGMYGKLVGATANKRGGLWQLMIGSNNASGLNQSAYISSGDDNVLFGHQAGNSVLSSTGNYNTMIGGLAGFTISTSLYNTLIGYKAGYVLTTTVGSDSNVMIGYQAGMASTSTGNILIGTNSGPAITTGNYNISIGLQAVLAASTLIGLTGIGYQAFYSATTTGTADYSVAIGYQAGYSMTSGGPITVVGYKAGYACTSTLTAVGYQAGTALTSGTVSTYIGYQAGFTVTTASYNTAVGYIAGYNWTTTPACDACDAFGYQSQYYMRGTYNTSFGALSCRGSTTASNNTGGYNIAIGYASLLALTSGGSNIAIGFQAGTGITTALNNTLIGYQAGMALTTTTGSDNNTFIGYQAGLAATSTTGSVLLGYLANGTGVMTGDYNICIGHSAGLVMTAGTENVIIGHLAGDAITTSLGNVLIGYQAGSALTTTTGSNNNVMIGYQAGLVADGATANVIVGYEAGVSLTSGDGNVCFGRYSGQSLTTGGQNVLLGDTADVDTGARTGCIVIGLSMVSKAADNTTVIQNVQQSAGATAMYCDTTTKQIGVTTSLRKFKTNIREIDHWRNIYKINSIIYDFNELSPVQAKNQIGLIAEDLLPLFPELCAYIDGELRTIHYEKIGTLLIKPIQDHEIKINDHEDRIKFLETENEDLRKQIEELQKVA
jgi:hypothetical protein